MDVMQLIYSKSADLVEDTPPKLNILSASKNILLQCISTLLFLPLSLACLPLYVIGLFIWGRPPTISPWSRFYKYFAAALTEGKPEEGVLFTSRVLVFVCIIDFVVKSPIKGVGWFLDEIFYPSYHQCEIKNPLFFITAPRSGSTQLADYLEADNENFLAPMVIEAMFPYIWAWRMIAPILKLTGLKKHVEAPSSFYGKEIKKRHNSNLFKTDSWEMALGLGHMVLLTRSLGVAFMKWGFLGSALKEQPVDREFCKIFIELNDSILKKVVFHRGLSKQQVFIKSHLLIVARELEQRYNGAKFLAVVRDPVERFSSAVNYLNVLSADGPSQRQLGLFPITWNVIRDFVIESQVCYCEEEMIFYKEKAKNKLAISFDTYVNNLAGTLQCIYSFLNIPVSAELLSKAAVLQKSSHDRTKRKVTYDPKYNRSLSSLGVDKDKLKEYLSDYINWVKRLA